MGSVYRFIKSDRKPTGFDLVLVVPWGEDVSENAQMQWLLENLQKFDMQDIGPDRMILEFVGLVGIEPIVKPGDDDTAALVTHQRRHRSIGPFPVRLFPVQDSLAFISGEKPVPLPMNDELGQLEKIHAALKSRNKKYKITPPQNWAAMVQEQNTDLLKKENYALKKALADQNNAKSKYQILSRDQKQMLVFQDSKIEEINERMALMHENSDTGATPNMLAEEFDRSPGQIRRQLNKARKEKCITCTDNLSAEEVIAFRKFMAVPGRMRNRKVGKS